MRLEAERVEPDDWAGGTAQSTCAACPSPSHSIPSITETKGEIHQARSSNTAAGSLGQEGAKTKAALGDGFLGRTMVEDQREDHRLSKQSVGHSFVHHHSLIHHSFVL